MKNFFTLQTESFLFWSYSFQLLSRRDSKKMSENLVKIVGELEINANGGISGEEFSCFRQK